MADVGKESRKETAARMTSVGFSSQLHSLLVQGSYLGCQEARPFGDSDRSPSQEWSTSGGFISSFRTGCVESSVRKSGRGQGRTFEHCKDRHLRKKETFLTPSPYLRCLPSFSHIDFQSSPHRGHIVSLQHNCIIQAIHLFIPGLGP